MNIFQKAINTVSKNFLGLGHSVTSWAWKLPGKWNKRQQLEQYNRYVYTIISAFALDFAKTGYKMMRTLGDKTQEIDHDLVKILDKPNPNQSGFQFRELHATYMKLAGESFWYLVKSAAGNIKEMHLIRPDLMDVEINDDKIGTVKQYILHLADGGKEYFEPDEIVHHKYPNPLNPWRGMGVVEAAMTYLQTEEYSSEWTKNSIYNSGRPSGILNLKGSMKDDQFKQLKEQFKSEYTGTANAGKTLLLKGFDGIDWAKLGMDLEGVDLEKVKDISREDIMFMFRTSNTIMGITDDVNRANSREMRGVWMENVVKPELDRFVDQINHSLVLEDNLKIEYVDPNPETIQDRVDEWTAGIDKWLTKNDIIRERNQILGTDIPEKEGGDMIWQPASLIPMEVREEEPETEPEEEPEPEEEEVIEEACTHVHKVVEKSPACRLEGESTDECVARKIPEIMDEGKDQDEAVAIAYSMCEKKCNDKKSLSRHERGELMRKDLFKEQEQWEKPYRNQVNKVFERQRKQILDRIESQGKNVEEWLFDKFESSAMWKEFILPIALEILQAQSKHMFNFVDDDSVQGELEITPALRNKIESRIERWAFDVDEDTRGALEDSIIQGMKEGESVSKLKKRIDKIYDHATSMRSERIARTETINLSNLASLEAMQHLPSVVGKEWMVNPGACEFCQPLNGQIVNLETNFVNQGEVVEGVDGGSFVADYEDVEHPPLHPNSYHKDTEAYTRDGFKKVKDIKIGEEMLSLNVETRDLEWVKVKNLISHEQDKLISFQSRNFDLEVTPDHDMLYQKRWDKRMGRDSLEFVHAKDMPSEAIIYRSSEWTGKEIDFETFGMSKKDFCKFMAYWLSDGSVNKHYIHISQHKDKYIIGDELFAMNLDVKETKEGFRVKNDKLADYLHQFGHAHKKYVPNEIKQLPKEYLREFLDAYVVCDGSVKKSKKWKGGQFRDEKTYFTTSKRLADDLGEIILKVGRRPSYRLQKNKGVPVEHKNGVYEGNYDLWVITECYSQNAYTRNMEIKEVDYNDMVYCVELEKNHTLYIRKNGKCTWCGNCRCTILPVNRQEMKSFKLDHLEEKYDEMDKRTKKAKEILEQIRDLKENNDN